jgi:hypothetical protein
MTENNKVNRKLKFTKYCVNKKQMTENNNVNHKLKFRDKNIVCI